MQIQRQAAWIYPLLLDHDMLTVIAALVQTRRRRFRTDLRPSRGSSSPFSWRGLIPIKPVYDPDRPDGRLNLTASAFNQGQYTSSPGRRGYCYAEQNSPFSSPAVAVSIASPHCTDPRRDGQAELAWVAGYVMRKFTCPKAVTHPSTNRAQGRATAFIETNALPLH